MPANWRSFFSRSQKWLKTGWLIMAGVVAVYFGVILPRETARGIAEQRATGLGAVTGEPISLWRASFRHRVASVDQARFSENVIGGVASSGPVMVAGLSATPP